VHGGQLILGIPLTNLGGADNGYFNTDAQVYPNLPQERSNYLERNNANSISMTQDCTLGRNPLSIAQIKKKASAEERDCTKQKESKNQFKTVVSMK